MAWIVWNFKKRRVKRKARRGRRIAWGEGEVKGDIRCQTEGNIRMLVHIRPKSSARERATYVDMSATGTGSVCFAEFQTLLLEIMASRNPGNRGGRLQELGHRRGSDGGHWRQRSRVNHGCREAKSDVWSKDEDLDLSREARCKRHEQGGICSRWQSKQGEGMKDVGGMLFLSFSREMRWPGIHRPAMMGRAMDRGAILEGANIWRSSGDGGSERGAVCGMSSCVSAKTWSAERA